MSNFIHGDHSDISGIASNAANDLEELAGLDMTNFPPPVVLACPDLVTESSSELTVRMMLTWRAATRYGYEFEGEQ
jgi:chitin synthase